MDNDVLTNIEINNDKVNLQFVLTPEELIKRGFFWYIGVSSGIAFSIIGVIIIQYIYEALK